jgi:3-dehydroquinate synthase
MTRIEVALGERSYTVEIGAGLLDEAGDRLAPFARGGRIVAVSDDNVWAAQGARLAASGLDVVPFLVPPGEASKSWAQLEALCERLLDLGVERGDTILAFGGGMVGDLAGFAAAVLKRGCAWVQVPTSLLAQVDSSVGGKTAINAAAGKNLIGAFHQPAAVLIDPTTLGTLPARELRAGYAEVVKYGLIGDPGFFAWCEANGAALLAGDEAARLHAIATCVSAKAAIVGEDERETKGQRALLNFGHTFGHAIEAETGILHGEAVAIGMAMAFRRSVERGLCPAADAERAIAHLDSVGLPTATDVAPDRLAARMRHDKKGGALVLTRGIGRAFLATAEDYSGDESSPWT